MVWRRISRSVVACLTRALCWSRLQVCSKRQWMRTPRPRQPRFDSAQRQVMACLSVFGIWIKRRSRVPLQRKSGRRRQQAQFRDRRNTPPSTTQVQRLRVVLLRPKRQQMLLGLRPLPQLPPRLPRPRLLTLQVMPVLRRVLQRPPLPKQAKH